MDSQQPTNPVDSGGDEEHACVFCERTFPTAERLAVHAKVHREDVSEHPFKCTECSRVFRRVDKLRAHQLVHQEGKRHRCQLCPKAFTYRQTLLEHMRRHDGVRPFQCDRCPKRFYFRTDLQSHVRRHTNERLHRCRSCPKSFVGRSDLLRHERSHDGDRPYPCTVCGHCFSRNAALTRHMRLHTGERPFQCHLCPNSFTRAYLLEAHLKDHPGPVQDEKPAPVRKNSRRRKGPLKADTAAASADLAGGNQEVIGPPGSLATVSDNLPQVKPDPELVPTAWSSSSQPSPHYETAFETKLTDYPEPIVKEETLFISNETVSPGRQLMATQEVPAAACLPVTQQEPFGLPSLLPPPQCEGLREVKQEPEAAQTCPSPGNLVFSPGEALRNVKREDIFGLEFPLPACDDIPCGEQQQTAAEDPHMLSTYEASLENGGNVEMKPEDLL